MSDEKSGKAQLPLVWVKWMDSECHTGWTDGKEIIQEMKDKPVMHCESVGWLIEDGQFALSVAGSRCPSHGSFDEIMRIPRCCVLEVVEIQDA